MKQLLLVAAVLLASATGSMAQEDKGYKETRKEECAEMRTTTVGKARTEEIVHNCRFFIECGMPEEDYINCARGSVINLLLYELYTGNSGGGDDDDGGGGEETDEAAARAIMSGKGIVNYGDLTYGDVYDKMIAYTKTPKYVERKEREKKLKILQAELVTEETWPEASTLLKQLGYSDMQLKVMKEHWQENKRQGWTYGDLLMQMNGAMKAE